MRRSAVSIRHADRSCIRHRPAGAEGDRGSRPRAWLHPPRHRGSRSHRHRHHRQQGPGRSRPLPADGGRRGLHSGDRAVQARLTRSETRRHGGGRGGRAPRRPRDCRHGRARGGGEGRASAPPGAVESEQQILAAARGVRKSGASLLRGGAFKPRTSPYDFQGLREKGLELLEKARSETGLKVVTEVKDTETLPLVAESADLLQIGARNMQNFSLLEAVGDLRKPVLLKRGMSSTIKELLMAAEYIVSRGNKQVVLCERGIRTFETMTRNTLDLNAVPMLKSLSHLPVVVDPSHGIGIRSGVLPMARAAVAAGADGLIIEVHPDPDRALSDGMQSLDLALFETLMREISKIASAVGRSLHRIAA